MENNLNEEDLHCPQSSSGPTLKPEKAFIHIDSISIDLPHINSKNGKTTNCEHFSIRKYVSDRRQKESKTYGLFGFDKRSASAELDPTFSLPPIDVPKFRWWQCRNCLEGVSEKENGKPMLVNNLNVDSNSDGPSCSHIALTGNETMVLVSEFKQILNLNNSAEKGDANAGLLVQVTADESHALPCSDQKHERDGRSNGTTKVSKNGLEDDDYVELPRPTTNTAEANETQVQEQEADDSGGLESVPDKLKATSVVNFPEQLEREAAQDCHKEMKAVGSGIPLVATGELHCGVANPAVQKNEHLSYEPDYLSSDSAEACPGERFRDKPGGVRNRKVRKVRLLSDLLGQNGSLNVNSIDKEESPLSSMSDPSEELGARVARSVHKMKRKKIPEDEYRVFVQKKKANEIESAPGAAEENLKAIAKTDKDDLFAVTIQGSFMKSRQKLHPEDESSGLVTKKGKKKKKNEVESVRPIFKEVVAAHEKGSTFGLSGSTGTLNCDLNKPIDEGSLRIVTEKKNKKSQDKHREQRAKHSVDFSPVSYDHNSLMSTGMGSSSFPLVKIDRNSCMCKKRSEAPDKDVAHKVHIPHKDSNMIREDMVGGIKFGLVPRSESAFLPSGDDAAKRGTSFASCSGQTGVNHALLPNHETTILCKEVGGPKEGQARKKNKTSSHVEPNVSSRNRLDGFVKKAVHHNLKSQELSDGISFSNQNPHFPSGFEDMGPFLMPQKGTPSLPSRGEITLYQEQSTAMKNQTSKVSNKACARETCSDDIPMDIVELMAKIQYENSLHDTTKDQTRVSPSYQNPRLCREYKNGLQKEGSTVDQVLPKYGKKLKNANQGAVDIRFSDHINMNHPVGTQVELNQDHPFKGHSIVFSQYPEQPSGSRRNEDTMGSNLKKSSGVVGGLFACDTTYHIAGPSEEPFRLWSSSTLPFAHFPSEKNVAQNHIFQSSDMMPPRFKVRKKSKELKRGFFAENSSMENSYTPRPNGVKVQSPLGSSEICSNEKISALHLLSLMDAHTRQNVNGTPIHSKQSSSIPLENPLKELDFGAYRASDILGHPSSEYRTINFLDSGKYDQHLSAVSSLGSPSLDGSHENIRNGVTGQLPLKVREKGKKKCSDLAGTIGDLGSQKYVSPLHVPVPYQQSNEFTGLSTSAVFPPKYHAMDKSEEHLRNTARLVWPMRQNSATMGICTINRNPAEFSIPEVGNMYTIRGKDLKIRKRARAQELSIATTIDLDRPKRGRKKKIATDNRQQAENVHHPNL
ncbi:hypothetical protein SAY87_009658 [Trapa incisa]|uniref:Embryonic flower 1 n=1 Tax=Trapa incisa TaxID=236973 RepID=A0AAN7JWV3_9MYRT|nr:hypothetical protein SAY87_009658 [Trapa incisa]